MGFYGIYPLVMTHVAMEMAIERVDLIIDSMVNLPMVMRLFTRGYHKCICIYFLNTLQT